jgi:SsrA-binding protein
MIPNKPKPKPKSKDTKEKPEDVVITTNRDARRDYFVLETMEAGIALVGCEVKSLRASNSSLAGAFARMEKEELFLYNLYIAPYIQGNRENPESKRPRKLLLHRSQIEKLHQKVKEKGLAIVPLKMYFTHGLAKVEIALVKGKNHYDRRQDIKSNNTRREIDRAVKDRNNR